MIKQSMKLLFFVVVGWSVIIFLAVTGFITLLIFYFLGGVLWLVTSKRRETNK